MGNDERRDFVRIEAELPVDVHGDDGSVFTTTTHDISFRGVFLAADTPVQIGLGVDLTIWLGQRGAGMGLRMRGTIARQTKDGVGVLVDEISFETFEHLRRLITFNASDPDQAEREIRGDLGLGESA